MQKQGNNKHSEVRPYVTGNPTIYVTVPAAALEYLLGLASTCNERLYSAGLISKQDYDMDVKALDSKKKEYLS